MTPEECDSRLIGMIRERKEGAQRLVALRDRIRNSAAALTVIGQAVVQQVDDEDAAIDVRDQAQLLSFDWPTLEELVDEHNELRSEVDRLESELKKADLL
ncbi:MAG: hypothetical protein F4X98_18135 [Gammaproteobacteria bacterium]|nr:hypothetical protein [Gammaproteobacteria bacterium]